MERSSSSRFTFKLNSKEISIIKFITFFLFIPSIAFSSPLDSLIYQSTLKGKIRSYMQSRELNVLKDERLYLLGAQINFETGPVMGLQAGGTYFVANDFDVNRDDLVSKNPLIPPSNINIFGEAYLQYKNEKTLVKAGRQVIDTPFMNPADSFMFPVSYLGYRVTQKILDNWELTGFHATEVKIRQSDTFEDAGQFVTKRLGIEPTNTAGTTALGTKWNKGSAKLEVWDYYFYDLFNMIYVQGDFEFDQMSGIQPYLSLQAGHEFEIEESLLGEVNSWMFGALLGAKWDRFDVSYMVNFIPKDVDSFRNGGYHSPYNFATDALYTNSLDGGLTIKDTAFVGSAQKANIEYSPNEDLWIRLAYVFFDMDRSVGGRDSGELNFDIAYQFNGALEGLDVRYRLGWVDSRIESENLIENRLIFQYIFGNLL
jgi:hypothetical protein